jgi:hypothetical protein
LKGYGNNQGLSAAVKQVYQENDIPFKKPIDQHDRQKHKAAFAKEEAQVSGGVVSVKDDRHGMARVTGTSFLKK